MRKIFALSLMVVLTVSGVANAEILAGPGIAVAETVNGKLQGFIRDGIYIYHGVQYATAKPFMPPEKISSWDGVKLALNYGTMSPQSIKPEDDMFPVHYYWPLWEARNYPQDNSCQNLNIWTPGLDDKKRPVMIWLHGGGFQAGSSLAEDVYSGENLSRKGDAVVVSVNHRLNVLGFLDLSAYGEKYKYSGNLGMMDIVAALEWVKANIANFGGDPDNVTLFGQSGGGAKILTLMAIPSARGLFHKAIVQSGAVSMMGITLPEQEISRKVAELVLADLGIAPENVDSLKDIPFERLDMAGKKALAEVKIAWAPIKDGDYIPQDPVEGGFAEQSTNIPLLIGTALNEWVSIPLVMEMAANQSDNKNFWDDSTTREKLRNLYGDKADSITAAFLKAYPNKKAGGALYVDTRLRVGALKTMNIKAQQPAPVYAYVFTWETPIMGGYAMAYHCSELPFVFNNIALSEKATGGGEKARALADVMSRAWIDFARTGNPGWEAYTPENGATMIFDDESAVRNHHDAELMKLLTE